LETKRVVVEEGEDMNQGLGRDMGGEEKGERKEKRKIGR
jgi:hypothetical protein